MSKETDKLKLSVLFSALLMCRSAMTTTLMKERV